MSDVLTEELIELTKALATERQMEAVLVRILAAARRLTRADGGRVLVSDFAGRALHAVVSDFDGVSASSFGSDTIELYRAGSGFNLSDAFAYAAITGQLTDIANVQAYAGFDFSALQQRDRRFGLTTQSLLLIPLIDREGASLGLLELVNLRLGEDDAITGLPEDLVRPVESFAAQAALAIVTARLIEANARLITQLDRHNTSLSEENAELRRKLAASTAVSGIIGESRPLKTVLDLARRAAATDVPVLVLGETGTGKELIAHAIHRMSLRSDGPMVAQNCAALPEELLESELFGYRKGAFTGATSDRSGLVQTARGGTLFLDEVGDMPLGLQAKLLRLLQEGEVRPLGSVKTESADIRVIAATNVDLSERIAAGTFREDLYYRLGVFPVLLPPLRERPTDIPVLLEYFLTQAAQQFDRPVQSLTPDALDALMTWRFPGNIRELKNLVDRSVLLSEPGDPIGLEHLPPEICHAMGRFRPVAPVQIDKTGDLKDAVQRYEALVIETRLRETRWNQSRAANMLGISRRSLIDKMQRYDIRKPTASRIAVDPATA
ncbi:MAG: sigma 54-interacting transcriptional regulator [Pseudomonadota bacterium]